MKAIDEYICKIDPNIFIYIGVLIVVIGFIIFTTTFTKRGLKLINFFTKHILLSSLIVWICGIVLYTIGFNDLESKGDTNICNDSIDHIWHWLAVVPRAIVASFKMFVVMHDLARVSQDLRQDVVYMALISITHFAAAFITFIYIVKVIGYKLKASFELRYQARKKSKNEFVHVFWDINESSCQLAENIYNADKKGINHTIIFIATDNDKCDCNMPKRTTLSSILHTFTINPDLLPRLNKIDAKIAHCQEGPEAFNDNSNILNTLKLNSVTKIIKHSSNTYFYFLSDDENQNISAALNLFNDNTLKELKDKQFKFFVHARKSADNEVFDHYSQYVTKSDDNIVIKLIDSAYLSILTLKQTRETLPVNFVNVDTNTGTVNSEFSSLILGFGATGQEAFKFLYEFASFIDLNHNKIPFRCTAIDQNMNSMAGKIRQQMPLISNSELSLVNAPIDTEEYWSTINKLIPSLNYIFVTVNDDNLGLKSAVTLFKYALQHRSNISTKLKIMVRCYNRNYENRFNEVLSILNESANGQNISLSVFGTEKQIYTYENICLNQCIENAKEFHWVYANNPQIDKDKQWEEDFGGEQAIVKHQLKKENPTRFHAIFDINRKINQDVSNSLHMTTKLFLMGIIDQQPKEYVDKLKKISATREKISTVYTCYDDQTKTLLENLAITEHERWISAHKLMGFTCGEKNMAKKQHPDMIPWQNLNEYTKSFDCNVIHTTLKLTSGSNN